MVIGSLPRTRQNFHYINSFPQSEKKTLGMNQMKMYRRSQELQGLMDTMRNGWGSQLGDVSVKSVLDTCRSDDLGTDNGTTHN